MSEIRKFCAFIIPLTAVSMTLAQSAYAEPYGWSPNTDHSFEGNFLCTSGKPKAPILYQPNHPALPRASGRGQLRLQWTKVPGGSDYIVYYGLSPHNYIFSVPGTGDTDNYTVGFLANRVYYFAVQAKAGCQTGPLSQEWAARPGGGGFLPAGGRTLGAATRAVVPVARKTTILPTSAPQVQGIETAPPTSYQPVYEEPTVQQPTVQIPQRQTQAPVPQKKGFFAWFKSLFGFR